ncbi:hypothetical protein HDU99_006482, partial [Rhizoclosmatium hyalinum]
MTTNASSKTTYEGIISSIVFNVDYKIISNGAETVCNVAALKDSINTITQHLMVLKIQISDQEKNRSIEWACTNAAINAFSYWRNRDPYLPVQEESTSYVKRILLSFKAGRGHPIAGQSLTSYKPQYNADGKQAYTSDGEEEFRNALINQIHELLGKKPR